MTLGDGTAWDELAPANSDNVSAADDEIRDLRKGVRIRVDKEHVSLGLSSAGGEHRKGSARVYRSATASPPTQDPEGNALDATDDARMWMDSTTKQLSVYSGSAFEQIKVDKDAIIVATKGADADYNAIPIVGAGRYTGDGVGLTQKIAVFGAAPIKHIIIAIDDSTISSWEAVKTSTGTLDWGVQAAQAELNIIGLLTGGDAGSFNATGAVNTLNETYHFFAIGDWTT